MESESDKIMDVQIKSKDKVDKPPVTLNGTVATMEVDLDTETPGEVKKDEVNEEDAKVTNLKIVKIEKIEEMDVDDKNLEQKVEIKEVDVGDTELIDVKKEKIEPEKVQTSAAATQNTPDKKVIMLNTMAISKMFKSPPKPSTGSPEPASIPLATSSQKSGAATERSRNQQEIMKLTQALATALKTESKKKVFCANTNCNLKTDTVFDAPSYARCYFGMPKNGQRKICMYCMNKADKFNQKSKQLVRNQENLFQLSVEIQTASSTPVVDLDSPVGSPEEPDRESAIAKAPADNYLITLGRFSDVIEETLKNLGLEKQVKQCTESLSKQVDDLSDGFKDLDVRLEKARDTIEATTKTYNDHVSGGQPVMVEIGSLDIDQLGVVAVAQNNNLQQFRSVDALSRTETKKLDKAVAELKSLEDAAPPAPEPARRVVKPGAAPHRSQLIFAKPKVGQEVYAMSRHSLYFWLAAKVIAVNLTSRPVMYTVQFQQKVKPRSKSSDERDMYVRELTGKQVAFKKSCTVQLPIGCRVIAKFKDLLETDAEVDGMLYAGVTAECPKTTNGFRYLIFFDDGYAQYVHQSDVFPVAEASPEVWVDVHNNSRDFIRDYVKKYPNRHMIRPAVGSTLNVELNGSWIQAMIVEVDSSLMKVKYLKSNPEGVEYEWVYRGSTRIGPLFMKMKQMESKSVCTVARRHTYSSRNAAISFEVNRDTMDDDPGSKVMKKSTGGLPQHAGQTVRTPDGQVLSTVMETMGSMVKVNIPEDCPTPRPFVLHNCSPACAHVYVEENYRRVSPLVIPFYLGWARQMTPNNGPVYYYTPCGIRCGSYRDIHAYIVRTQIEIPIDCFSLENTIDCLNAFEPGRKIESVKDISYGKEWTPVAMVNSLDHDLPVFSSYITSRVKGEGVDLNDEDGFLACCDCEDDCQDKEKCACWQLTLAGISFKTAEKEGETLEGYENRRLKNHVLSGIYECNRNCKCRSTCFNRVVQNKVKWPVQIFKTICKGWGVRALHDMPQGSFICVYTGQLLTDAGANASGIQEGDEFLAELDFIECNEQMKEDYESDVTDIENEEPGAKCAARLRNVLVPTVAAKEPPEAKKEEVAKKSTGGGSNGASSSAAGVVQKAVKSTRGVKRLNNGATVAATSSISPNRPVARKSGSKNGTSISGTNGVGSKKPSPSSSGVPSPALSKRSSKDDSDSDDEDGANRAYSSFCASSGTKDKQGVHRLPLREYFGKDEAVYIMDAKNMGNFGRYLNHSCDPNVFVQNLFVDTHDPRFPWVAFFTKKDVKAGTELTWDYNYEIGSVPGKTLYCYCLQQGCRGRLL
ncbi:unnamed protein product [Orchesella dallaii]|uniref:Histone-lysine N-methyltransferase eggless n=1 Tax=Orchesella dallaii TaxID=48710 RepID=A0ABP1QQ92_9HEXA